MYKGEYSHTIDAKGRVIIPSKLREALGEGFVIARGLEGCLYVYDAEGWKNFEEKLETMPDITSVELNALRRFMIAGAVDGELDKQGRVMIPNSLRTHADLKKDVVFAGVGKRVEIWDKDRWESALPTDMSEIGAKLESMGLRL